MAQGYAASTFTQWGTPPARVPHSPPGCYQSTSPLRRKRPFAAYAKVVGELRRVTISSSRARLYPPLQGGPAFLLLASRSYEMSFLCTTRVRSNESYIRL
jgi:hypothetical protein